MSNLNTAICLLIESFSKHAGKDGNALSLTKSELKELLQSEFGELLGKANDKAAVDRIFQDLDTNGDNTVDFAEFGRMIFSLTVMCHDHFTSKK